MTSTITRRRYMTAGVGSALVAGLAAPACAGATRAGVATTLGSLDLTHPRDRLKAYMLMRGALDGRLVVGCLSGRYYGVVGDVVTPLFGVVSATFAQYRPDGAGGYLGGSYEVPFFTDLKTGEVMDRWTNPYTEEILDVPHSAYPPSRIAISPDLKISLPNPPPGLTLDHHVLPAMTIGNDVWMTEETFSTFTVPGAPVPVRYTEVITLHATHSDLNRPGAMRVPCQTAFEGIVTWRPWMNMGVRPGHLTASGAGLYGVRIEDLPAPLLRGIKARKPDVLADPKAPLAVVLAL